ncbi:MAG TPA: histidine kinase, partial [Agromyces sp.]
MFSDDRTVRGARRWPLRPAWVVPNEGGDLRASLGSRGAVSWYIGGGLSLLWLFAPLHELVFEPVPDLLGAAHAGWFLALGIGLLVVYALAFLCSAPVVWVLPGRLRPLVPLGLFALSFTLVPWYGWGVRGVWTYVGVAVGMCVLRWRPTMIAIVGLAVLAYLFGIPLAAAGGPDLFLPAIILSISLMMAAFARQLAAMNELRSAQEELQVMAADRERGRIARDMHDLLGHSLTVITVKSELAGRLVDLDPDGAKREIGEIEQLARGALADVRTTVSGFRGASLGRELSAARV